MRKHLGLSLLGVFLAGIIIGAAGCAKYTQQSDTTGVKGLTEGISTASTSSGESPASVTTGASATPDNVRVLSEEEKIINECKSDVATLLSAWKAADEAEFRGIAAKGYAGSLLDQKVNEAKSFIATGKGANVDKINFDKAVLLNKSGDVAVVQAEFTYSGHDCTPSHLKRWAVLD